MSKVEAGDESGALVAARDTQRKQRGTGVSYMVLTLAFLATLLISCQESKPPADTTNYRDCPSCHKGIEEVSPSHTSDCLVCHVHPEERQLEVLTNHERIIRNPSDPMHVGTFCLPCHEREVKLLDSSLHSSMAGIINQTRYLWGAQRVASPALYGLSGRLKALPHPDPGPYPEGPEALVDDFLRRRCLRCHIRTRGPEGPGLYRSTGCAACHMIYDNDGLYKGHDQAIEKSKSGYPSTHRWTKDIPNKQCLHCHNQNNVGADYEGFFEHDYSSTYRSPMVEGTPQAMIYGLDQHHLAKDIHGERGLWCIDCHTKGDIMGDGNTYSHELEVPMRQCSDCHGGFENKRPDPTIEAISLVSDHYLFRSRDQGKRHLLKLFSEINLSHSVRPHKRVRCSACHAQWSYQDYGLSVIREDMILGYKWYRLTAQGDPYLERILTEHLEHPDQFPVRSKDWLTGRESSGIWSMGWRFRRWEYMVLGIDQNGRYTILRPRHQYLISYVDQLGHVSFESVVPRRGDGSGIGWAFTPYVPHTISPFGRGCDGCHQNRVAVGLGLFKEWELDTDLMIPSPPPIPGMRLMTEEEKKRLLEPSEEWRRLRLRALIGKVTR